MGAETSLQLLRVRTESSPYPALGRPALVSHPIASGQLVLIHFGSPDWGFRELDPPSARIMRECDSPSCGNSYQPRNERKPT